MEDIIFISCVASIVSWIIFGVIWGFACRAIVKGKGYPDAYNHGFAWGFWLGLIGLIVCACKSDYYYKGEYNNPDVFKKQEELLKKGVISQEEFSSIKNSYDPNYKNNYNVNNVNNVNQESDATPVFNDNLPPM